MGITFDIYMLVDAQTRIICGSAPLNVIELVCVYGNRTHMLKLNRTKLEFHAAQIWQRIERFSSLGEEKEEAQQPLSTTNRLKHTLSSFCVCSS